MLEIKRTITVLHKEEGVYLGEIEEYSEGKYCFYPWKNAPLEASDNRQIADKLDELNSEEQ